MWLKPISSLQFQPSLIGNYPVLTQSQINDAGKNETRIKKSSTFFIVLKPEFEAVKGIKLLSISKLTIFDNRIKNGSVEHKVNFIKNTPKILTVQSNWPEIFPEGTPLKINLNDSAGVKIVEIIHYNRNLSDTERRKIESYLAIKYAINISKNNDENFRSYIYDDYGKLWNHRTEGAFNETILGLGRFDKSDFYQTQTSDEGNLVFALDTLTQKGQMPKVFIEDMSFIIFSSRKKASQNLFRCSDESASTGNVHPLFNWKIKTESWQSDSKYIRFVFKGKHDRGHAHHDTLFLTDGIIVIPVYCRYADSVMEGYFSTTNLRPHTTYFFEPESFGSCPDSLEIKEKLTDQGFFDVTITSVKSDNNILVKNWNTNYQQSLSFEGHQKIIEALPSGQYSFCQEDGNGNEKGCVNKVLPQTQISDDNKFFTPVFNVYPNPVNLDQEVVFHFSSHKNQEAYSVIIIDGMGKPIFNAVSKNIQNNKFSHTFRVAGVYQIIIRNSMGIYTKKIIVI
ncbi:MAG: T9SS type A sorting domain-containing protein [Cryomorphaceae bacterium]|nr:T9SS type A sorting domain-containing protein [Cryomorphaceae bacterium]